MIISCLLQSKTHLASDLHDNILPPPEKDSSLQVACMIISCLLQSKTHLASDLHDNILPPAEKDSSCKWLVYMIIIILPPKEKDTSCKWLAWPPAEAVVSCK